jgi:hypothetical protein
MPAADRCVEEILDGFAAGQGPTIGGSGGLKCRQVWMIALEQRLQTARIRRIVFILVQKAPSLVIPAYRFAPGHKPRRKRK